MRTCFHLADQERLNFQDELDIIRRISVKDEKALADLYDMYSRVLFSIILKIVKNEEDAKDLLQSVFLQIWEKASYFDFSKGNVYTWIVTMSRNKALDKLRSRDSRMKRHTLQAFNEIELCDENQSDSLDITIANEKADFICSAMRQISPEQKEVIEMAFFGGYTHNEIASMLNIPLGTIKTRMRQGMKKLHSLIDENI
ncbi:MAG: RNA polymerase sigma factor [Ignavibacteriales bacterium]